MTIIEIEKLDSIRFELIEKFVFQLTSKKSTLDSLLIESIINEEKVITFLQ